METTPISVFRGMGKEELLAKRPLIVTFEGEPIGLWADPNSTITIEDLHPAVRRKFRAMESTIRASMGNANYKDMGVATPVAS